LSPWVALFLWWASFVTWNEGWLPVIDRVEIVWHNEPGWPGQEGCGWYEEQIHVRTDHSEYEWRLPAVLMHELNHYLADVAKLDDWDKFANLAMKEMRRPDAGWTRHQVLSVKGMIGYGGGYELHAELPTILEGDIPPCLQRWYPWFDLKEAKAK